MKVEDRGDRFFKPARIKAASRVKRLLPGSAYLLGIVSLVWLIVRSGRKPSRLAYPCQRAALANTYVLLGGGVIPFAARLGGQARARLWGRAAIKAQGRATRVLEGAFLLSLAALLAVSLLGGIGGSRLTDTMKAAASSLALPELRSDSPDASDIFVAEGIPVNSERGVDMLIDVMARNGLDFFRSSGVSKASGPDGIVASDDIVLIKVNGEWRYRGGTNTDVVKGLVNAIVHHPDGFTGEVVIVENGQWDSYMDNLPDNRNPDACNAEDRGQSFNDVALMFADSHRVSVYDWTAIQTISVGEFDSGDMRDGYVYVPEIQLGYPKFTTVYGTRISLRHGEWTGAGYDNERVKFINLPVLKDHGGPGVTNALKHFMGVQDLYQGTQNPPHGPMVSEGILAKLMLVARYPDLNISDAIWVCPSGGPNAPYDRSVRLDRLIASRDPVALDYYCGKYVLMPISGNPRHDPEGDNQFHQMLAASRDVLVAGGKRVTMDESVMNVYKGSGPDVPPPMPYETFLAEGCTDYGFETWVLVANPNHEDAVVKVSYYTEEGPRNAEPVTVPADSRLTINASATIWAKSSGVRVGSDLPVLVERAMYWDQRREGHTATGTTAGSRDWYLAEGCTDYGFETWVTVLNPGERDTVADLRFLGERSGETRGAVAVPARSRVNVRVNDWVAADNVSTVVSAGEPVVAEVSLYGPGRGSGTCSMGVTAPGNKWYLAEGATHSGFETWLLLLNPGEETAEVAVRMDFTGGGIDPLLVKVAPRSRATLRVNDFLPGCDLSMRVESEVPVVASRSMYWETPGGRAGHECHGLPVPARETFLPEGCTAFGFDTWLLVYNPGEDNATAVVYALTEAGQRKIGNMDVPARSRKTLRVGDLYEGSLSLRVVADQPVCCERSTYWSGRAGGTCSPGCGL
ncbi:MAG: DUF362 domain-containing protein [Actinobacteria bacterium]|nr:DUF362 domain-containing protein [Actinomycetota bacterium]